MATPSEVGTALQHLCHGFPDQNLPKQTVQAYIEDLADIPGQYVIAAARELRRTARWFPRISDLHGLAECFWRVERVRIETEKQHLLEAEYGPPTREARERARRLMEELARQKGWPTR